MRRGHFNVTNEFLASDQWPLVQAEIDKVFTLEIKEQAAFGQVSFHGTSDLFDESIEGSSPQYDAIFMTIPPNQPRFVEFKKA